MNAEDEGEEFTREELVPLPAKCSKCRRVFVGRDAIRAPSLDNCSCFYCWGKLKPHPDYPDVVDAATLRRRRAGYLI
jgi:hypothetical protein